MAEAKWNLEDSLGYQEMTQRAAREAWELYQQGEEYRARRREDAALIQALGKGPEETPGEPPAPEEEDIPLFREREEDSPCPSPGPPAQEAGGNPWQEVWRQEPPPRPRNTVPPAARQMPPAGNSRRGLLGGLDQETLILLALLFILWREGAEKEILLALLYILLV